MISKIISGILILLTVYLNFTHGWGAATNNISPEQAKMMSDLGLNKTLLTLVGISCLAVIVLTLIPQTFFIGNILNACVTLLVMACALKVGNYKMALIEIPFIAIPLVLIYLGHPFKK